jgi:hypothetical protein
MNDHAEGQNSDKAQTLSGLDWPTPEQITAARRLRGQVLREMTVLLFRRLRRVLAEEAHVVTVGRTRPRSVKARS